jgi:hypothetical protein
VKRIGGTRRGAHVPRRASVHVSGLGAAAGNPRERAELLVGEDGTNRALSVNTSARWE